MGEVEPPAGRGVAVPVSSGVEGTGTAGAAELPVPAVRTGSVARSRCSHCLAGSRSTRILVRRRCGIR